MLAHALKKRCLGSIQNRGSENILDALLRPVQIPLHLLGGVHAVCEIRSRGFETALGEGLEFEQFAVFRIEFAGSVRGVNFSRSLSIPEDGRKVVFIVFEGSETYACACLTNPRSNGIGSKVPCSRSLSISTRSTLPPTAEEEAES